MAWECVGGWPGLKTILQDPLHPQPVQPLCRVMPLPWRYVRPSSPHLGPHECPSHEYSLANIHSTFPSRKGFSQLLSAISFRILPCTIFTAPLHSPRPSPTSPPTHTHSTSLSPLLSSPRPPVLQDHGSEDHYHSQHFCLSFLKTSFPTQVTKRC